MLLDDSWLSCESSDTDRLQRTYYPVSINRDKRILSVAKVKEHLKIDDYSAQSDTYYESLIDSATGAAEHFTRREIVEKIIRTYANGIGNNGLQIRKASLLNVESFTYLDDSNTWITLPINNYYYDESRFYSTIYKNGDDFPIIRYDRNQTIKIDFKAGWLGDMPDEIPLAILNHVAVLHEQRGDWGSADIGIAKTIQTLPSFSQAIYGKYRIQNR